MMSVNRFAGLRLALLRSIEAAFALWTALTVSGCEWANRIAGVSPQQTVQQLGRQQQVQLVENRLIDAGFKAISAKSPEDFNKIQSLPPLELTYRIDATGKLVYYYADPYYCYCLFRGDEAAYQRYEAMKTSAQQARSESHAEAIRKAEEKATEAQTMGPFGIDSPFGGAGPGASFFAY